MGQAPLQQPRTCRLDHSGLKALPHRRQGSCHVVELDDVATLRVAPLRLPSGPIAHELNHEGVADGGLGHEHERPWSDLDARQHQRVLDGVPSLPHRHRPQSKGKRMPQEGRLVVVDSLRLMSSLNGRRRPRKDEREVAAFAHRHQDGAIP